MLGERLLPLPLAVSHPQGHPSVSESRHSLVSARLPCARHLRRQKQHVPGWSSSFCFEPRRQQLVPDLHRVRRPKSHATVTAGVTLTGRRIKAEAMKVFNINGATLSLALYTDVTNSKELLESMQAGTLEPEVAFLNALLILDVFPLLAAAHKTLVAKSRDSLTTRTLHSELIYNYSGSKHISESLKRCGISDNTTYILAARFDATPNEIKAIEKLINGKEIELEELEGRANQSQIQKHYKIYAPELGVSSLADAITCRIASRDAL
ncbi:EKC/KEOPS complex subunit TPRKB isoform X1 [Arachis ipaensis]|uniref:EKC/KEOPS complex subunit TPRKB isoform X1 n=2 Tax=Arachis ipaensis TaxID=130454 RepID=UPI000A2B36C6|nr:EKC/KEOPS complex subunit TPRKB isoform X1 [Arachis ipaensis]XP_025677665.1 EKC/KEOPS complex subunit TPRKB isoform X1 [Arachis hypogaea]